VLIRTVFLHIRSNPCCFAQRLHEESYRVVAVEGIQDIQHIFHFESRLQQQFPEIVSILLTFKSTAPNDHFVQEIEIFCLGKET
jgi:hypothetical protein